MMERFEFDDVALPPYGVQLGRPVTLNVHDAANCAGEFCCIHNPSDHPLKDAPMNYRFDRDITERYCEHGIGHDDPDDLAFRINKLGQDPKYAGIHGCDGCCRK
jgi:hypothetical protein